MDTLFITLCFIILMYFVIFSFCPCIIYFLTCDCEDVMENGSESDECDEEHIDDFIMDNENRHPNVTIIDGGQKTSKIVFIEVCG